MAKRLRAGDVIPEFRFDTPYHPQQSFYELLEGEKPVFVVFLRNFGHPLTRHYIMEYIKSAGSLRSARLVCVVQTKPQTISRAIPEGAMPYGLMCDAESVLYRFFSPSPASVIPTFRPTWVPEGYWEVDTVSDDTSTSILYQRGDDSTDQFIFGYMFYSSDTEFQLLFEEKTYGYQILQVHEHLAHFYSSEDHSETNNLIWFNEKNSILFELNAPFDLDVMLHIAESINLVK